MATFRTIVSLKNGGHKTERVGKDIMAHLVTEFRKMQRQLFNNRIEISVNGTYYTLNDIKSLLFINEWTGERLEIC